MFQAWLYFFLNDHKGGMILDHWFGFASSGKIKCNTGISLPIPHVCGLILPLCSGKHSMLSLMSGAWEEKRQNDYDATLNMPRRNFDFPQKEISFAMHLNPIFMNWIKIKLAQSSCFDGKNRSGAFFYLPSWYLDSGEKTLQIPRDGWPRRTPTRQR